MKFLLATFTSFLLMSNAFADLDSALESESLEESNSSALGLQLNNALIYDSIFIQAPKAQQVLEFNGDRSPAINALATEEPQGEQSELYQR